MWLVAVLLASLTAPQAPPTILYVGDSVAVQNAAHSRVRWHRPSSTT